jgi:acetyl esterase/lipase
VIRARNSDRISLATAACGAALHRKLALFIAAASLATACRKGGPPRPFTREGVIEQLRASYPHAALPSDELPPSVLADEDVVYVHRPERDLELDVYRPVGGGLHPGLIVVHGGGWETGDRRMERPLAKRLSALGYAAAPVSYRLGKEGRFPAALDDLRSAVAFLRENAARFAIDPDRIGAVGGSAGGQLVALLGATNGAARFDADGAPRAPCDVEAVVDIDGLADFTGRALVDKENAHPGAPTRFLGGSYAERTEVWREASAIHHIGPRSAPTLFINSTAPTPILPGRSELCDKLKALGKTCEIIVMPGTPHPFWLVEPWFDATVKAADRFLRAHLERAVRD